MSALYRSKHLIFIAALFLAACSTQQTLPPQEESVESRPTQEWLEMASQAEQPERSRYQLEAAWQTFDDGNVSASANIVNAIQPDALSEANQARYLILKARIIDLQESPLSAASWLSSEEQIALLDEMAPATQLPVYMLLADLQSLAGLYLPSASTRIYIEPLLEDEVLQAENQDKTWQALMNVPPAEIHQQLNGEQRLAQETRGWLELAIIAMENQGDIEQQLDRVETWEKRWSKHPAALRLPGGMALLKELANNKPAEVAVLLPLSGRLQQAGSALRDGIIAAHYQAREAGASVPTLSFYDTAVASDINALYWEAVTEGAEMVIGPLNKARVRELTQSDNLPVPVLALNYSDTPNIEGNEVVQFGLSSNDEAAAIASRAQQLGYRRAMIIHSTDAWSTRTARHFNALWAETQGELAANVVFEDERGLSNSIRSGLQIQLSQARARRLASITGEELEFTPRRRHDVDFVFLPVSARQARSIKPLLAFHFAEALPVIATSRIYTGKENRARDNDLNDILFTETPWVLGTYGEQFTDVISYIEQGGVASKNLYALGVDAYQVAPRIPQLLYSPHARFFGQTGTLMLNADHHVVRKPEWAVFKGGRAIPVSNVTGKDARHETQNENIAGKTR